MKLVFQFGSHPLLSLAELVSRFPHLSGGRLIAERFYIIESNESPSWLMQQLGGVVKIMEVIEGLSRKPDEMVAHIADHAIRMNSAKNKVTFGVSIANAREFRQIGIAIKREIQAQTDRPVRSVVSRDPMLSSATVHLEKLLPPEGVDFTILKDSSDVIICQTVAVQAFDEWSFRDYGRPGRDAKRGMLPPKLAKIMINIALGVQDPSRATVYDPFCGSGTVLIEASLMGVGSVMGSDVLKEAVDDTRASVVWAKKQFGLEGTTFEVFKHDASERAQHIKPEHVDCVASEPFLGRPLKKGEQLTLAEKQQLVTLYNNTLRALFPIMTHDARLVFSLPFQVAPRELLPLHEILEGTGFTVDPLLPDQKTILYMRSDQRTGRQIVRLVKKTA